MKDRIKLNGSEEWELEVIVRGMDGRRIPLEACGQNSSDRFDGFDSSCVNNCFFYRNHKENYRLDVSVEIEKKGQSAAIRVKAGLKSLVPYDIRYHFSAYDSVILKFKPVKDCDRIAGSCYYIGEKTDCWAKAFHAESFSRLPERVASLVWKRDDLYYNLLPLCDKDFKSEIKNMDNSLCITCSPYCDGYAGICAACAVITWGNGLYQTVENNVAAGFEALGIRNAMRKYTRLSEAFHYLGWCSWDSFHYDVNSAGIYEKMEELKKKKIPVKWVLVDDGWYPENEKRQMLGFTEVREKFPEGLSRFIEKLKSEYGVKYAGIWECFSGGWTGIAPDCEITAHMPEVVEALHSGMIFPRTDEAGSFLFWNRRHEYLYNCGFDFIKADVESNLEACIHGNKAVGKAAGDTCKGLEASLGLYFDGACIHCTGMGQEELWNRKVGMVNRNSADFDPQDVSTMNDFVNDNLFNSLYHSQFNVTDWDMMWSDNPSTKMNTVLHALSGGIVYLSDPIGRSNPEIIWPFCRKDGCLCRCDGFAYPTQDCFFTDALTEKILLKAQNHVKDCGVLGVFHVNKEGGRITDTFRVADMDGMDSGEYLLYHWYEKNWILTDAKEVHSITLDSYDAALFLAAPVKNGLAVLGNIEKYIAPAVIENRIENEAGTILTVSEAGTFAFYAEKEREVFVNGMKREYRRENGFCTVDCSDIAGNCIIMLKESGNP